MRRVISVLALVALVGVACASPAEDVAASDDDLSEVEETETTTAPVPAEGEECSDPSLNATFMTLPPHTCDDVYNVAAAELLNHGWTQRPPQTGLFIEVVTLCAATSESTYLPESTHIPALADLLMGRMCDADRSLIVPA